MNNLTFSTTPTTSTTPTPIPVIGPLSQDIILTEEALQPIEPQKITPCLLKPPANPCLIYFNKLIESNLFADNGTYLSNQESTSLTLDSAGKKRLALCMNKLKIASALLKMKDELAALGYDLDTCVSMVGSRVYEIYGAERLLNRCKTKNVDIPKEITVQSLQEELNRIPDTDLRVFLHDLDKENLEKTGQLFASILRGYFLHATISGEVKWKKAVDIGYTRCYTITFSYEGAKFDIVFASKLLSPYLYVYNDVKIPLSLNVLSAIESCKSNSPFPEHIPVTLCATKGDGLRSLYLYLAKRVTYDQTVDWRGAFKYLVYIADGRLAVMESQHRKLFSDFYTMLKQGD